MNLESSLPPQAVRGMQLRQLGRYAEAEKAFREALAQSPDDAFLWHQLAGSQMSQPGRCLDALETIEGAIRLAPEEAGHFALRAYILCQLERPKEALVSVQIALGLDPLCELALLGEAQAHLLQQDWAAAEKSARRALQIDAENRLAANQLAQALRLQNKATENATHLAGMLARDPEDAFTHANAGWAALQSGAHREAETHFREALRIHPDFEYAREGLVTSFRARSPIYRAYLRYVFAMQRLRPATRWIVMLGLYFGVRIAGHMKGLLGLAVVALYFLFVLWVWVARPVGNVMLLFDPFARYALRRAEKWEAAAVGGALASGVIALALGVAVPVSAGLLIGIGMVSSAFPLSLIFTNSAPIGRWLFGSIVVLTLLSLLACLLLPIRSEIGNQMFMAGCMACLASTWLGNLRVLHRR